MSLFISFDTETTGLNSTYHEVIEMCAVVLDSETFKPTSEVFSRKLKVEKPERVAEGTLGVYNHYDKALWDSQGVSQMQGWSDFCDWIFKVSGNGVERAILVGHNIIKFDSVMVETWTKHFMLKPNVSYHSEDTMYQYIMACQMIGGSPKKCSLKEVAGFWRVPFSDDKAHGSMYDAIVAGLCYAIGRHYIKTMIECGMHDHTTLLNEAWRRLGQRPDLSPLPKR